MILGFHLTWTTYGHWFPNDPRGSWSDEVWQPQLAKLRKLDDERKVTRPRPVPSNDLKRFLDSARSALMWNAVQLTRSELAVVAGAFAEAASAVKLRVFACAIMPTHAHIAVGRNEDSYERIVNRLKGRSAQRIREFRAYPAADRRSRIPIWTQGYWVRYIDHPEQMQCVVNYVKNNPIREGLPSQDWGFVQSDFL
ncbi:MAG TPA: transposase [Phycisphaerae bacterium]|nr:transposase [Phycisphaerae bacterium]